MTGAPSTTADHDPPTLVLARTAAAPGPSSPPSPPEHVPGSAPAGSRLPGATRVSPRAARRLVEGILAHRCPQAVGPKVEVDVDETDIRRGEVRIAVSLAVAYPEGPLLGVLSAVRRVVADEVTRCLGRPADRIDLLVTHLVTDRSPGGERGP